MSEEKTFQEDAFQEDVFFIGEEESSITPMGINIHLKTE